MRFMEGELGWMQDFLGLFQADEVPALPAPFSRVDEDTAIYHEIRNDSSILNTITGIGSSSDKGSVGRPSRIVMPLSPDELSILYRHNGICRRIVDLVPAMATRKGWEIEGASDDDARLQTHSKVREAMIWGRLYGGAPLMMVTEDDVPAEFSNRERQWLEEKLDLERVISVKALHAFDGVSAVPAAWNTDIMSPDFGLPSMWTVSKEGWYAHVHASRMLFFRGNRRPTTVFGGHSNFQDDSILQAIWDEVRRLSEIGAAGASLAQELRQTVLKLEGFDQIAVSDDAAQFQARLTLIQRLKSNFRILFLGLGEEYESHGQSPAGFDGLSIEAKGTLCAVTGIPEIVLFGKAPSGLNSDGESGKESFRQTVSDFQEQNRPQIERLAEVILSAQEGPTGGVLPEAEERQASFLPLNEPDQKALAEVRKLIAETDAIYIKAKVMRPADATLGRFGPDGWSIELDEIQPLSEEELHPPIPNMGDPNDPSDPSGEEGGPGDGGPNMLELEDEEPEDGQGREDFADDSVFIMIPAGDPGLYEAASEAVGVPLVREFEPHVTILFVGSGLDELAVSEVLSIVADEARMLEPTDMHSDRVVAFPLSGGETPIVARLSRAWSAEELNRTLTVRLAHLITARQFRTYRPHLTLGYATGDIGEDAVARLSEIEVDVRVPMRRIIVRRGRETVGSFDLGAS